MHKPFQIAVDGPATEAQLEDVAGALDDAEGIAGAAAVPSARADDFALVEAFSTSDGSSKETRETVSRLRDDVLPAADFATTRPFMARTGTAAVVQSWVPQSSLSHAWIASR